MTIENLISELQRIQLKHPGIRVFSFEGSANKGDKRVKLCPVFHLSIFSNKRRPDYLEYAKKHLLGIFADIDKFLLL